MVEPISISAIIIASLGALGVFINKTHLTRIICCKCIESDCKNNGSNNETENDINILPNIITPTITPISTPISTPQTNKKYSDI
jgi:hypothetical protein